MTFDDLPATALGPEGSCDAGKLGEFTDKLLAQIVEQEIPALGLVTESRVCDELQEQLLPDLLRRWLDAGFELGNHTFSHPDLNQTELDDYLSDIERGARTARKLLEERGERLRYFRYPMLHTGDTEDKKQAVEQYLDRNEYENAPVTLDNQEWIYSAVYSSALAHGDRELAEKIGEDYVDFMMTIFDFYEPWSVEVLGYEPPQVLLLHANEINADYFGDLAERIRGRGYEFVTLADALEDPAYSHPETYVGRQGLSWLHRWALSKGMEIREEPREPEWIAQLFRERR